MDKSDCNTSCSIVSQVAVMIINVIFGVFGFIVLGIGVSIKGVVDLNVPSVSGLDDYTLAIAGPFTSGANALIVLGVFIFFISILGCAAGCIQNKWLLLAYAFLILFILIYIIVVLSVVFGGALMDSTKNDMTEVIKKHYVGSLAIIQSAATTPPKILGVTVTNPKKASLRSLIMDSIQLNYQCCGVYGATDYTTAPLPTQWPPTANVAVRIPATCCKTPVTQQCLTAPTPINSYMNVGCLKKIEDIYNGVKGPDIALLVILLFLTLALLILSMYIFCTSGDEDPTQRWQDNNYNNNYYNDNNSKKKKKTKRTEPRTEPAQRSVYVPNYQPQENQYDSRYGMYDQQGYDNFYDGYGYSGQTFSQVPSVESGVYTPDWYSGERPQAPRVMSAGTFNPGFVSPYGGGLI